MIWSDWGGEGVAKQSSPSKFYKESGRVNKNDLLLEV